MNTALPLASLVGILAAAGMFHIARISASAWRAYRAGFQVAASRNLSQMFLFVDPRPLFTAHVVLLALAFGLALLLGVGPLPALALVSALGASPPMIYTVLRRRRLRLAVSQLPDALLSIATSLRAGMSLPLSLETLVAHQPAPLGQELQLLLRELRMGIAYDETLDNLHRRLPEIEVQLFTAAMKVSREIGGNLAEALDRIAETLRRRLQMEGKIHSLTAQGRLQGLVMTGLPVFLVLALTQMEPRAMRYLFDTWYGWVTLGTIVLLEIVGYHFIRRIVDIDV